MKITRRQLRQIIQEELGRTLRESPSTMGVKMVEPPEDENRRKAKQIQELIKILSEEFPVTLELLADFDEEKREAMAEMLGVSREELDIAADMARKTQIVLAPPSPAQQERQREEAAAEIKRMQNMMQRLRDRLSAPGPANP